MMIDTQAQAQFTKACADAAAGYAEVSAAAYSLWAQQSMKVWSDTAKALSGEDAKPTSWYRHPDEEAAAKFANPFLMAFEQWNHLAQAAGNPWSAAIDPKNPFANPFAAYSAWLEMTPLRSNNPMAWPMAFGMLAAGMPKSVALPAAEANASAMDAANIARETVERAFATYRSSSGHAVAAIKHAGLPTDLATTVFALTPMGALMAPWLKQ